MLANEHKAQLEQNIYKEVDVGPVLGSFSNLPVSNMHISPIGLVPKSSEAG